MKYIATAVVSAILSCAFALPLENRPTFIDTEFKSNGPEELSSRVVGGSSASDGQFPYIASLRLLYTNTHFCGGSIISGLHILTAAHCTEAVIPSQVTAVVGTTRLNRGGTRYSVRSITIHANYEVLTRHNDLSIVKLTTSIVASANVATIPLGSSFLGAGYTVTLSGWGSTYNGGDPMNELQYLDFRTMDNDECAVIHDPNPVYESSLCAFMRQGLGTCIGDSGGPLVYDGILVGVVSWGIPCAQGYPDVYGRVSYYIDWIQQHAT